MAYPWRTVLPRRARIRLFVPFHIDDQLQSRLLALIQNVVAVLADPMTQTCARRPPHLLATSISSSISPEVGAAGSRQQSRAASEERTTAPSGIFRSSSSTDRSDEATTALIRRVLCPPTVGSSSGGDGPSIETLLPPLTSSNVVDLQLYALLAIVVKEFVYSWYSKITPDHRFVDEVVRIVAHCTRALEERIRGVDVHGLVVDEIPALIEDHVTGSIRTLFSLLSPSLPSSLYGCWDHFRS